MTRRAAVAARGGGAAPPNSGDCGGSMWGVLRLQEDDAKLRKDVLILLPFSILASEGKRRCAMSYPVFMPKLSTHRMHDPGSIVSHIRPKVLTDNQMS
jgi:hypothetical protein